jgi:AraC-like DNA-binding protein
MLAKYNHEELQWLDDKIFKSITTADTKSLERELTSFYNLFTAHPEDYQIYILNIYYTSLVTGTLRFRRLRGDLQKIHKVNGAALIRTIQSWEYSSEFFTAIPWLSEKMTALMSDGHLPLVSKPHIKAALHLIDQHLNKSYLSVGWLARQLNLSQPYLSMSFKEDLGETLSFFITKKRMKTAALDLQYTSMSLSEIAQKYGYRSMSHFIEVFKNYAGKTPAEYRSAHTAEICTGKG